MTPTEAQAVAARRAVPPERVRLGTEAVTARGEISPTRRTERIGVEGDVGSGSGRG